MRSSIRCAIALGSMVAVIFSVWGCRIKTVDTEQFLQPSAGHLNQAEARRLVNKLFREHGVKVSYNVKLNLKGVKVTADGFDYNLQVGFVYLISPTNKLGPEVEPPRPPTDSEKKVLADIEKNERTYILYINEGTEASITEEVGAFIQKLYKVGVIFKQLEEKPSADGGIQMDSGVAETEASSVPEKKALQGDSGKPEKSRIMKLIEDEKEENEAEKN